MIGKICPRGQDVAGLIRYLYGPGCREEHTDPHIIAGYRPPADLEPPLRADGSRDFRRLAGLLRLPHDALGTWGYARPVWHCSVRTAPEDRLLSDAEWASIARDVIHRTGLCPRGEEDDAVRWIAIRHGPDHIHLVAVLARQDRTRPRIVNERYRVRDACIAAEQKYGLRPLHAVRPLREQPARRLPEVSGVEYDGEHVMVTESGELANVVILTLARAGVTATGLHLDSANLEDAFPALTGRAGERIPARRRPGSPGRGGEIGALSGPRGGAGR